MSAATFTAAEQAERPPMTTPEVEVQRAICYAIGTLEHLSTMALTQPDPHERDMQIELTANAIGRLQKATEPKP